MTVTQYLGTGAVSRGRLTIRPNLNTVVSTSPYLHDDNDKAAVVTGIENLQKALTGYANITWITPKPGVSASQFVNSVRLSSIS
jgi:cellobiose dehydrogenase (acceptor)